MEVKKWHSLSTFLSKVLTYFRKLRKIAGSKYVQVKVIMPPEDGIMRETPTIRAVGRNMVWHNFSCCSDICYAFMRLYLFCRITENRRSSMTVVANRTPPIMCFCLDITSFFHPPIPPGECHCNMVILGSSRANVTKLLHVAF